MVPEPKVLQVASHVKRCLTGGACKASALNTQRICQELATSSSPALQCMISSSKLENCDLQLSQVASMILAATTWRVGIGLLVCLGRWHQLNPWIAVFVGMFHLTTFPYHQCMVTYTPKMNPVMYLRILYIDGMGLEDIGLWSIYPLWLVIPLKIMN